MRNENEAGIIAQLQSDILRLQGFKVRSQTSVDLGLGPVAYAFPNATFPLGAVHEFLAAGKENTAATSGFIAGLLSSIAGFNGAVMWISSFRTLFPPALKMFGIDPDRFIFTDLKKEKDVLWAMEEAIKCDALSAVVGEIQDLGFTASRRLQLAVEQSHVTGLIVRNNPRKLESTACVSRWRITTLPSQPVDDLPGVGFPQWRLELLRVRNGKPGVWDVRWNNGKFEPVEEFMSTYIEERKKAG